LPDPLPHQGVLAADALTARGVHVDPLAWVDHQSPLWNAYFTRISEPRSAPYLDGLREFMRRRAGGQRGADGVISFTISWVVTPLAPPGVELRAESRVRARIAVLLDTSRSMRFPAAPGGPSRAEAMLAEVTLTRYRGGQLGDFTTRLALQEEAKSLPFGAVWDYYSASKGVPVGENWLAEIKRYEKDVLSQRQ